MESYLVWITGLIICIVLIVLVCRERMHVNRLDERSQELERLSQELLRINRDKSEFLASISHEIRTPLNAIVGFAELLSNGVYGTMNPAQQKAVYRMESSANHLRQLIDQILDLAKIAAGRMDVNIEPVNLKSFLMDLGTEIESLVVEKNLHFSLSIPVLPEPLYTDPTHLRQIIINLLGNAIKYSENGVISIKSKLYTNTDKTVPHHLRNMADCVSTNVSTPPRWIGIHVSDPGIGIAPANHERIFETFVQIGDAKIGTTGSGTHLTGRSSGLGLPISRKLARLLNGDVTVESEPGKGSTFTVWLLYPSSFLLSPHQQSEERRALPRFASRQLQSS